MFKRVTEKIQEKYITRRIHNKIYLTSKNLEVGIKNGVI